MAARSPKLIFLLLTILLSSLMAYENNAYAETVSSEVVGMYIDAPFVQRSYASGSTVFVEDFENMSGTFNNDPVSASNNIDSLGTGVTVSGNLYRYQNNTYGGASSLSADTSSAVVGGSKSKFVTIGSTAVTITFATPVKYIGFYWTAGNNGNTVRFRSKVEGSNPASYQLVASMTTNTLTSSSLLGFVGAGVGADGRACPNATYANRTNSLTASNNSTYLKRLYYGHPAERTSNDCPTTGNSFDEPFAFIHAFALNGQTFDQIEFVGTEGGFEIDNITVSTGEIAIDTRLVTVESISTTLTVGSSAWSIRGVTSSNSNSESTGWRSDSVTATSGNSIVLKHTLEISSGATITPGITALLRANLNDTSTVSCGSYSVVDSFTVSSTTQYETITVASSGSLSRTTLIRGYCYVWTKNPTYTIGTANLSTTNATRPSAGTGTIFRANLDSPVLYLPKLPDVKIPSVIPIIPGNQSVSFPSTKLTQGSGQVQVCFFENDGSSLNGTWGTLASNQNLRFTSNSTSANPFIGSSITNALNLFNDLKISRINNSKFSIDRFVLIRIAPYLGTNFSTNCEGSGSGNNVTYSSNLWPNSQNVYMVRLKSMNVKRTHSFVISPRNGRLN